MRNLYDEARQYYNRILDIVQLIEKKGYWSEKQSISENVEQHIMSFFIEVFIKNMKIDDGEAALLNVLFKKHYSRAELISEVYKSGNKVLIQVPIYLTSCIKMDLFESSAYSIDIVDLINKLGFTAAAADNNVSESQVKFLTLYSSSILELVSRFGIKKSLFRCSNSQPYIVKSESNNSKVNNNDFSNLLCNLNELIGLAKVKEDVNALVNYLKIRKIRMERGLPMTPISLHLVFTGNPGTGKTTIAREISKIYKELGILSKGHIVEVDRSGLIAGYVGQTAARVQEVVNSAIGGVLFIDEAYSLVVDEGQDFGTEAISTLLKAMEDNRENLIVIVAGYTNEMEHFIDSNPGLRSRFNKYIVFEDYAPDEMLQILKMMCGKSGYELSSDAEEYALQYFIEKQKDSIRFGNARGVRNMLERAISNQANRIVDVQDPDVKTLMTIEKVDLY